ncbi:MAG: hypothetical protein JWR37_5942 [Mycobacterium sp.]|nr:hypothetical protein [Mycobacterium sp.]
MTATLAGTPTADAPSARSFELRRAQAFRLLTDAVLVALGAVSGMQLGGFTLTMLTPICLVLAPAFFLSRPTLGQWLPLTLALVGFAAFFVSSQINHLSVTDQRVLQWAAFAVYYVGFLVLAGRDVERAFSLLCGIAIGTVIYYALPGGPFSGFYLFADLWKYAWAPWVTIMILFVLTLLKVSVPLQAVFLIVLGGFSMVENFRSHAIVCVAAAAVLLVGRLATGTIPRWVQMAGVGAFGLGASTAVPAIALSGIAGDAIKRKTELQANSGVPPLLAGRTESPLSISAILDRPWFGWGTANNITPEVFERAKTLAIGLGFNPDFPIETSWYLANGAVSLHSVLLTAWAEGGLLAALLPIGLLAAALVIIWNAPRYGRWSALAVVVAVQAVWDLLFSPTSYNLLPTFAILLVVFAARHLPSRAESIPAGKPA